MLYFKKNTQGFTLIEALIALTVTSLGALALASFQTDLTKTGGLNKTRSEALVLAEAKLATFKNITNKTGYSNLVNGQQTLTGTNATFTRQWILTDKTNPKRKQVEVNVSWGALATDKVTLMTVLTWTSPGNSNLAAIAGANQATPLQSPSPNNNSSILDSNLTISQAPEDAPTETEPDSGLFKTKDVEGNTILIDVTDNILLTCFGNTLLEIKGTVYTATANKLDDIDVAVSRFGYCAFNSGTQQISAPYSCFVCGNDNIENPDNPVGPGGWRGKVGLTGLVDSGGGREKVCQSEHINDINSEPSTAREYTTLRTDDNGKITSEGINTPYACQNFLIIDQTGNQSNCATEYANTQALYPNETIIIAHKKITRKLTGTEENTVLATNNDACGSAQYNYTVSGTISGTHTNKVTITISESGFCNTGTDSSYQCTVTSNETDVTLTATTTQNNATITSNLGSFVGNGATATGDPTATIVIEHNGATTIENVNFISD